MTTTSATTDILANIERATLEQYAEAQSADRFMWNCCTDATEFVALFDDDNGAKVAYRMCSTCAHIYGRQNGLDRVLRRPDAQALAAFDAASDLIATRESAYALGVMLGTFAGQTPADAQTLQYYAVSAACLDERDRWAAYCAGRNEGLKAARGGVVTEYADHPVSRAGTYYV